MKRGQKRTKRQKRKDALALRMLQNPSSELLNLLERELNRNGSIARYYAASRLYHLSGRKPDLRTLGLS